MQLCHGKVKSQIDISKLPEEYQTAIKVQIDETLGITYGRAIVDYDADLEMYRGLDPLIRSVNPLEVPPEHQAQMRKLMEICPNVMVTDKISQSFGRGSTVQEYFEAEEWMESVLEGINPEWSDIQKVAYIDNALGRKISYSPDFEQKSLMLMIAEQCGD